MKLWPCSDANHWCRVAHPLTALFEVSQIATPPAAYLAKWILDKGSETQINKLYQNPRAGRQMPPPNPRPGGPGRFP